MLKSSGRATTEKTTGLLPGKRVEWPPEAVRNDKSRHPEQVSAGVVTAREEFPATPATEADCAARTAMVVAGLSQST